MIDWASMLNRHPGWGRVQDRMSDMRDRFGGILPLPSIFDPAPIESAFSSMQDWRDARPRWNGGQGWEDRSDFRAAMMDWRNQRYPWLNLLKGGKGNNSSSQPNTPPPVSSEPVPNVLGFTDVAPGSQFGRLWG